MSSNTLSLEEDTLKKEKKRWTEALNTAHNDAMTLDEMSSLGYAKTAISFLIDKGFKEMPNLLGEQDGRRTWERYLSGLRYLSNSIEHSFLLKTVLPMFFLGEVKDNLLNWNQQVLELTNELYYMGNRFEQYTQHITKAMAISDKYEMCALYSSLKTWDTEEKFDEFAERLESFLDKPFEVYIEGPIQLYLTISKNNFFVIMRSFLVGKLTELLFPKRTEEQDLVLLNERMHELFKDSKTLEHFITLMKGTAKLAIESWTKEHRARRGLIPTVSSRKVFTQNFEAGYIK